MRNTIVRWVVFSVFIGSIAILFKLIYMLTHGIIITYEDLLSTGQLLLITTVLAASGIGELIFSETGTGFLKNLSLTGSIILLLVSAYWFGIVSTDITTGVVFNECIVATGSLILYVAAIITSCFCITLAEVG